MGAVSSESNRNNSINSGISSGSSLTSSLPVNPLHAVIEARLRESSRPASSSSSPFSSFSSPFSSTASSSFTALRARQLDNHLAASAAAAASSSPLSSQIPYKKRPREAFNQIMQQHQQQQQQRGDLDADDLDGPQNKRQRISAVSSSRFPLATGIENERRNGEKNNQNREDDLEEEDEELDAFNEDEDLEVVKLERNMEQRRSLEGTEPQNGRTDMISPIWRPF